MTVFLNLFIVFFSHCFIVVIRVYVMLLM